MLHLVNWHIPNIPQGYTITNDIRLEIYDDVPFKISNKTLTAECPSAQNVWNLWGNAVRQRGQMDFLWSDRGLVSIQWGQWSTHVEKSRLGEGSEWSQENATYIHLHKHAMCVNLCSFLCRTMAVISLHPSKCGILLNHVYCRETLQEVSNVLVEDSWMPRSWRCFSSHP